MIAIVAAGLLGSCFGYLALHALRVEVSKRSVQQSVILLAVLLSLAAFNFEVGVFAQKRASSLSFQVFKSLGSGVVEQSFVTQAFLNAPAYLLFNTWTAAIGTNCALVALIYLYTHGRDPKAARFILVPAVANFAIFALRDPIIGLLFFVLTLLVLAPSGTRRSVGVGLVTAAMMFTRPENLVLIAVSMVLVTFRRTDNKSFRLLSFPILVAATALVGRLGPALLGLRRQFSLGELPTMFDRFYQSRARRFTVELGGRSPILREALPDLHIIVRYPIQILTYFVLPLPFEIRSISLALAAVDSVVFIALSWRFLKTAPSEARLIYAVYLLSTALFSANYGNVFRIRMPLYFIMAAGMIGVDKPQQSRTREPGFSAGIRRMRRFAGSSLARFSDVLQERERLSLRRLNLAPLDPSRRYLFASRLPPNAYLQHVDATPATGGTNGEGSDRPDSMDGQQGVDDRTPREVHARSRGAGHPGDVLPGALLRPVLLPGPGRRVLLLHRSDS